MKTRMTLVLFLALASRALAQTATNELLAAPEVRDFLVLQTNGSNLEYEVDGFAEESFNPLPAGGATFVVGKPVNLLFHNFNPFDYSISSTQSQVDDTSFASLQKFLDALTKLGNAIGGTTGAGAGSGGGASPQMVTRAQSAAPGGRIPCANTLGASFEFASWTLQTQNRPACQDSLYKAFCAAGEPAFQKLSLDLRAQLKVWEKSSTSYDAIYTGNGVEKQISDQKAVVDTQIQQAKPGLAALQGTVDTLISDQSWTTNCKDLTNLTLTTASNLIAEMNKAVASKQDVSDSLGTLVTMLDKYKKRNLWDHAGTSYRFASVTPSFDKIQKVAVTINQRSLDTTALAITETKLVDATISIRHYAPFVPEVAAGVAVTDIEIPKYGTAQTNGKTVVASAGNDRVRTIPTVMFNGIFRFRMESYAYPMFQIGIGTGADRPSIVGGIGLRFTHPQHLALSIGYAVTWFKDLDKLKVGDEVNGTADLNADLKLRRSSAKPYISIQYSF